VLLRLLGKRNSTHYGIISLMTRDRMTNRDLADTFKLIGDLLEIKGENIYKILAYRKAADSLNNLGREAADIARDEGLTSIPGVGKAISDKIAELLETGKLAFLEKLEQEVPPSLAGLLQVPDLGPKKVALFWKQLGVTDLAELEAAARQGKLRSLPGMGEKSEAKIIAGIEALARRTDRLPLGRAWPAAQELLAYLRQVPGVLRAEVAGSLRRMRSTIGDVDLIASAQDPHPVMEAFIGHPDVLRVVSQGDVKSSVEFTHRLRAQLWVQPPERYGTALVYATGSKDHNVRLRELALDKGLSLSDKSFLKQDGSEILCSLEEQVYTTLGLPWIPPELREDRGEVEAALAGKLPRLLERRDLRADLHDHSTWSDGTLSIRDMALAAKQRGLTILAITDHSGGLGVTGGPKVEQLEDQRHEIDAVQREMGDSIRLLQGTEVEIKADGTLDYPDEALAKLDIVIASLHVSLRQPRLQVTQRLVDAINNPNVDIIGHPTGRLIPDREGADLDMDAVLSVAQKSGVALEINAHPARLDLDEVYARRASEMGIPLSVNTDAHAASDLDLMDFGVASARRAWVAPENVINTWDYERLRGWLDSVKKR
jgi:DNA polymerase (family 10)